MEIKITANRQREQHKSTSIPFRFVFRESIVRHILFRDLYKNKITLVYLLPNVHLRKYLSGGLFMVFFRQKDSHRWGIEKCSNRDRNIFDYPSPTTLLDEKKFIVLAHHLFYINWTTNTLLKFFAQQTINTIISWRVVEIHGFYCFKLIFCKTISFVFLSVFVFENEFFTYAETPNRSTSGI